MTSAELRAKVEKAKEVAQKKLELMGKYQQKVMAIEEKIIASGLTIEGGCHQKQGTPEDDNCRMLFFDLGIAKDRVYDTFKAWEEKCGAVKKWEEKLAAVEIKESQFANYPDVFKSFQLEIVDEWDEWDKRKRDRMREKIKTMPYNEFIKTYSYRTYEYAMYTTDEQIHAENVRASERLLNNLWNRVKEVTGDAQDWHGLYVTHGNEFEGAVINGYVKGDKGTAEVETIGAGGYNIQRFHYRTLVHRI